MSSRFTPDDLRQLEAHGISPGEAERQLALLARGPVPAVLDRPCTLGDGIVRIGLEEGHDLLRRHADAADHGRVRQFVPASGAASRMFHHLLACRALPDLVTPATVDAAARAGRDEAKALRDFLAGIDRFAFFGELKRMAERHGTPLRMLVREGPLSAVLDALLGPDGLDFDDCPKALIPFHDYPDGARAPLEEHLLESSQIAADGKGWCRVHFTVSPEYRSRFEARTEAGIARMTGRLDVRYDVTFSEQHPSTDTIAASPEGGPFHTRDGRLLFRPAGHGALIENLGEIEGDLVLVKNVDNVAHDRWKDETFRWSRVLIGLAAKLESEAAALARRIERGDPTAVDEAVAFLLGRFHREPGAGLDANGATRSIAATPASGSIASWSREALARPIRVCGMVANTGEPGGGPMWVRGRDGSVTPQIVELSQVDLDSSAQRHVVEISTHFNPVFMALALRDASDRPYELADFVDADAVMITRKSAEGRDLLALERPGLWNGAMARWNTVFVEVPLAVFNPVKTVNDLLRREHQP